MADVTLKPLQGKKFSGSRIVTVPDFDYHVLAGNAYHCDDSTGNIGAETTPADTIEFYFTTPAATSKTIYAVFHAFCSTAAAVFTVREAYTAGGGASGDAVAAINLNRNSDNTSLLTILKQADAITSGATSTVLHSEILTAGVRTGGSSTDDHLWELKAATAYGISVYRAAAGVANVDMHWIEI